MLVPVLVVDTLLLPASRCGGRSRFCLLLLEALRSETAGVILAANIGGEARVVAVIETALLQVLAVGLLAAEVTDHVLSI